MYDIIVVGAGPAGLTSALYLRRAEKSVLLIEKNTFGGQITHSPRVENYPGFNEISGSELGEKFLEQVITQGADIELDTVTGISGSDGDFTVSCESGASFNSKGVIIATGSMHRTLGLRDEEKYTGEGISYCAVCDGAFYKDRTVAIIGGGNSALQEANMLSDICTRVTVIQNLDFFTGEKNLVERLSEKKNVECIFGSVVTEIIAEGDTFRGIKVQNTHTGEITEHRVDGMFVAIGQKPENEPFRDVVALNDYGYVDAGESCLPKSLHKGIFVAGDCRTKSTRQVATAVADGAVAALSACKFLDNI